MCSTKTGDCTKKNIVYQIECAECTSLEKKPKYFGETARTGFERMREHLTLLDNHPEKSALGDHIRDEHNGKASSFKMKLVSKHFKPLERQCAEAIQITEYTDGQVMNRRGEFGENLPPDFGILEDGLYRTNSKRKKVELKQQVPIDKANKRARLNECRDQEVCEQPTVCETACERTEVYEKVQEQTLTSTQAMTIDVTDIHTHQSEPTPCKSLANGEITGAENRNFIQCGIGSRTLGSNQVMHDSGKANQKLKLANGKKGSILNFLNFSQGHSGARGGSTKSENAGQDEISGSNSKVMD